MECAEDLRVPFDEAHSVISQAFSATPRLDKLFAGLPKAMARQARKEMVCDLHVQPPV
jgi:hypothetical protein